MSSLLPWPAPYLTSASWAGVGRLLARCRELDAAGALPGTLLLTSAPGLGREAMAIELAAALICREPRAVCSCTSCDRVRRGIHPDATILDVLPGNKEIKIDEQVRPLLQGIDQRPYEGRQRVLIVANAHTPPLNIYSASALLKTIEEPPAHLTV
ncbi:MAG: hypothetical protein V1750_08130, partial [Acidobacteriota bacterium]